jgi:membrane protein implicated in regulation of membrane protease activity
MESFKILYWHWLVFGMILMLLELAVPSFTIFWFGLGGLVVGLLLLIFSDMAVAWQIFLWIIASGCFVAFWFKVLKPKMKDQTMAGISREAVLGETAMVIRKPEGERRGELRFAVPVLGSETWSFICNDPVDVGDRVIVKEVSGNTMVVATMQSSVNPESEGES